MKDPCVGCKVEYPRCRRICPFGVVYQAELAKEREKVKTAKAKENQINSVVIGRMIKQKGHGGLET